jgi:pimeloyl-ACP methyl ester carboxylesterase
MQYFARRYPGQVVGMVLVDSSHSDLYSHLPLEAFSKWDTYLKKRWLAAQFGLMRLGLFAGSPSKKLSPETQQMLSALWLRSAYWNALRQQNRYLGHDVPDILNSAGPFPDIPLFVLTPPNANWTDEMSPEFPTLWLEAQEKLTYLSSQSKLMIAEESGHMIPHDQPKLVVDAIREVVEMVRRA